MDSNLEKSNRLYLVFSLKTNYFGIDALSVKEIIKLPEITKVPNSKFGVRGMIKFRERVIPILDMRLRMGLTGLKEENAELVEFLKQKEQNHKDYINLLEHSIYDDVPFTKTFNPRECEFGKWYYSYRTENLVVSNLLEDFEQPHNKIHYFAKELIDLRDTGKKEEAINKFNKRKNLVLNRIVDLFGELFKQIENESTELAIIYELNDKLLSFSVDKVYKIVEVETSDIKELEGNLKNEAFDGLFEMDDKLVVLLNTKIFDTIIEGLF